MASTRLKCIFVSNMRNVENHGNSHTRGIKCESLHFFDWDIHDFIQPRIFFIIFLKALLILLEKSQMSISFQEYFKQVFLQYISLNVNLTHRYRSIATPHFEKKKYSANSEVFPRELSHKMQEILWHLI